MKTPLKLHLLLSLIIAAGLLGGLTSPAHAADTTPVDKLRVILTIDPLQPIQMGMPIQITGTIRDRLGTPVAGKSVMFYLDNEVIGQISSDASGQFSKTIYKDLNAGEYKITAVTRDSRTLLGTATTMTLKVQPVMLFVQTTPAIEGVAFAVGGKRFYSDAEGLARISLDKVGHYNLQVLTDEYRNPTQRIEFGRWLEEIYIPNRDLYIPNDTFVQVGLNVYQVMGQKFVDLEGFPVDPSRITQFTFRSLQGDSFTFSDGQPRLIPASRVSRWTSILSETKIYYSVTGVMINGSNVVNQSQQRFYTTPDGTWKISLILYSLQVNARDGLFGFPVGKSISLEYPDGHGETIPLDANGSATIHSLARGTYYITVNGVSGMKNRLPVALSKNQVVNSKILTSLDLSLAVGLLAAAALGLLWIGRPWLLTPLLQAPKTWESLRSNTQSWIKNVNFTTDGRRKEASAISNWMMKGRSMRQTGLSREGFDRLLHYLEGSVPPAGKNARLALSDQLTMTLKHLKLNASETELAAAYGVSRSTVHRTIQRIETALGTCEDFKHHLTAEVEFSGDSHSPDKLVLEPAVSHNDQRGAFQ
ncbi:MAG: transposase family protein [Anaerolineaceae bacterium]|jgi:hypothetical protein